MTTNLFFVLFISSLLISHSSSSPAVKRYNVKRHFGAVNDGKTDATQPFLNAWNAACSSPIPAEFVVPRGSYFLNPIKFQGPCKLPSISFTMRGTLVTGNNYTNDPLWISFDRVDGLQITGGVIDGNGKNLWDCKNDAHKSCPNGAGSLTIFSSNNLNIEGLTSINSQVGHIKLESCQNVKLDNISTIADGNSPNSDGVHLQNCHDVTITNSKMMTGDDCVSMGGATQNIWMENIFCGPGHGISIGSLGHEGDEGILVQNVTAKSITFKDTQNGVRIKTLSTSINGQVKDIYFLGATMNNANNPIILDQNYCASLNCEKGSGSGIQLSNIVFNDIHGTSSAAKVIIFDCSPVKPCTGLTLQNVNITYQPGKSKCVDKNAQFAAGSTLPSNCQIISS